MKYEPHDYQKRAIKFMIERGCAGLFIDPGMGKTSCTLAAFKLLKRSGLVNRALVIAPLRPARSVWPGEVSKWDDFSDLRVQLLHGKDKDKLLRGRADIDVVNPEGLPWLFRQVTKAEWPWQMLVIDECFPTGTKVSTASGQVLIEELKVGESVLTSAGLRKIKRIGKRQVRNLVTLHLSSGTSLRCTPEHPVFTDLGWLPAYRTTGRIVYAEADLSAMRENVHGVVPENVSKRSAEVLLAILLAETDVGCVLSRKEVEGLSEHERCEYRTPVLEQGHTVQRIDKSQAIYNSETGEALLRTGAGEEGREWNGDVGVRSSSSEGTAKEVYLELRDKIGWEAAQLSHLLQSGLRGTSLEAGGRSGRQESQEAQDGRREERIEVGGTRVESVSHFECFCPVDVFNLEVEGCPHFFTEGILVHNSTRFKHTNTQRFKELKPTLDWFRRRYILTGTPAPNGLLDLFGQVYVMDMGNALGRYITHYRMQYFDATGFGGYTWQPKFDAEARIYKQLAPLVLRMEAGDYLKLPPLVNNTVEVELPPDARKVYNTMEELLISAVEDETVTAANLAAASIKCRQIANGGIYKDDHNGWVDIHDAKTEAVVELVEELSGKPALIAYEFKHDLARLRAALGEDVPHLGGGVTGKRQAEIEALWNAGKLPVLFAQPQSVAHGLNLQGTGAAVIWHSLTYDLENYEQLVRRIWRQGQKERVVVHHVVVKNTVDVAIMRALRSKDKTQKALLLALKDYAKQRRKGK